jgi:hypothetical protein
VKENAMNANDLEVQGMTCGACVQRVTTAQAPSTACITSTWTCELAV